MSLTHSICFVIIAICHYTISLQNPETETAEEEDPLDTKLSLDGISGPARFHWTQGIVPYYVDPESYDDIIAKRIRSAMQIIESVSCVVFMKKTAKAMKTEKSHGIYLIFTNPNNVRECMHDTLFGEGKAIMILGYDCMSRRDIIHSLLHVLGFSDEVTHPQRDLYIRIVWPNIQPKYRSLFRIRNDEAPQKMLVEYDTMSIMHFHDRAYSINGGATLAPLISGLLINPSDKLSQLDIMKLRLTYSHECNKRKVGNLFETCHNALKRFSSQISKSAEAEVHAEGSIESNDTYTTEESLVS